MFTRSGFSSPSPSAKGGISNPDRRSRWASLAKPALGVALAIGLLAAGQAQAYQFDFSYNDGTNTANGVLAADLIGSYNDIDSYHVTGGGLSVTGPNSGSYTIVPGGPGVLSIPGFSVNNVLYSVQDPVLDGWGLGLVNNPDSGIYINIWGNSPGNYSFWVFSSSENRYLRTFNGPATVSATARVPGPLPALGAAAAFGFSRKLRKRIKGGTNAVPSTYSL